MAAQIESRFGGKNVFRRYFLLGSVGLGVLLGVGTACIAALLMLLKTGWHAHIFPDFPFGMILDTLGRAPAWAMAGALVGLGLALIAVAKQR